MAYITHEDTVEYIPDDDAPQEASALDKLGERASDAIDTYEGVPRGFFGEVERDEDGNPVASEKEIFGNAAFSFLVLPPFVGDVEQVVAPDGTILGPTDYKVVGNRLYVNGYTYGETSLPYAVTAAWGWDEVPGDIQEAALQLVVRWWRGRTEAFSGAIGNIHRDGTIIERGFPASVKTILDAWKEKLRANYWLIDAETVFSTSAITTQSSRKTMSLKNRFVW